MTAISSAARLFTQDPPVARLGRDRVRALLTPRSVVMVGASDRSEWSVMTYGAFAQFGFEGRLHLVNRRGSDAHGRSTVTSCTAIGEPVDLAILLVSNEAIADALQDAADAGIRSAVLLGSGFAEAGQDGQTAQRQLAGLARDLDIAIVGPNGHGFANLVDRAPGWTAFAPDPVLTGPVALLAQSGSVLLTMSDFAAKHAIGISHMIGTGNEVNLDLLDFMDCLVEDERVRVLAVFAESIRDPGFFRQIAARAAELAKPIVMLKVGASELAARLALTHTGALVGNDDVIDRALAAAGVIRVSSLEQLIFTAGLLAHTGPLPEGGLGLAGMSGGINDVVADRASALGIPMPEFADSTKAHIRAHMAQFATVQNPFDLTGGASMNSERQIEPLLAIGRDPGVALLAYSGLPFAPSQPGPVSEYYRWIAEGLRSVGRRGVLLLNMVGTIDPRQHALLQAAGVPHTVPGVEFGLQAISHAMRWSAWLREDRLAVGTAGTVGGAGTVGTAGTVGGAGAVGTAGTAVGPAEAPPPDAAGVWPEARALEFLASRGLPVVPWRRAADAAQAVAAAEQIGFPVAVKVAADGVIHKSELGGVALGLRTGDEVREAFERVTAAARAGGAEVRGAVVAAMREGGVELIAGVVRDPQWGPALAIGLGGTQAEILRDRSIASLPVTERQVGRMLAELRGYPLLRGFRGQAAADLDRVGEVLAGFGRLASALGPALQSMEINPLYVAGSRVEILDAVLVWMDTEAAHAD
jgi:acyl-CoA synthetase (NDP forming)